MTDKFNKSAVPQEALNEFVACDTSRRQGNTHFLNGFRLAAEAVAKNAGVASLDNLPPADRKTVFKVVVEVARSQVKMPKNTFDRYCKIARYCLIYNVTWDIAEDATRDDLRWCKTRINAFRTGTKEDKMLRAWDERQKLNQQEKEEKERKEQEFLAMHGTKEDEEAKPKTLLHFPDPADFEDEDAYWTAYLVSQVNHIQKHIEKLAGGSSVKTVVLNFLGSALPIVKKAKAKPVMASAARTTK